MTDDLIADAKAEIASADLPPVGSLAVLVGRILRYEADETGATIGVVHDPIRPYREPDEAEQEIASLRAELATLRPAKPGDTPGEVEPDDATPPPIDLDAIRDRHDEWRRTDPSTKRGELARLLLADVPALLAEVERLRERLAEETAYAGTMTGVASQRASEIAGLHTEVEQVRRRLDSQRSQITQQAGRDAVVRIERDDARRDLAEVTRQRDEAQARETHYRLGHQTELQLRLALRAGVAELADQWGRESQRCKTAFDQSGDWHQRDRLDVAARTYRAAEVGTRALLDTEEPTVKPYAAAAIRCRYCGLPSCRCGTEDVTALLDQAAPETGPSATESHEDPAPSVPGTAHAQARDLAAPQTAYLDAAMHSVWLHGKWRWLTSCMSTAEREAAADAVDRHSLALSAFDGEERTPIERWWHEKADTGVADGGDTPQAHKAAQTVDLMGPLKASLKRAREARDAL